MEPAAPEDKSPGNENILSFDIDLTRRNRAPCDAAGVMKIRTAILSAGLLASSLALAQNAIPGVPGTPPVPPPAASNPPPAAPAPVDPFVREKPGQPTPQQQEDWVPRHLSVCVEYFSLDLADAALLQRTVTDDAKLYAEILARVSKGTATQEYFGIVCARSGERATVENVSEFIYPTEYSFFEEGGENRQAPPAKSPPVPPSAAANAPASPGKLLGTSFETRNLGFTLEIEPTLGQNDDRIDLRISPQIVTLVERSKWGKGNLEVEMPEFESQRLTLALTLRPRVPMLMGTPSRPPVSKVDPASAKKVWFSFVTVSVIKV